MTHDMNKRYKFDSVKVGKTVQLCIYPDKHKTPGSRLLVNHGEIYDHKKEEEANVAILEIPEKELIYILYDLMDELLQYK